MSLQYLDMDEQLKWLHETRHVWGKIEEGKVYLFPGPKRWLMEIAFRVLHYRVLLSVIVGPRGGTTEQVTVLDDRPKQSEVEHLFLVQVVEGSSIYSSGLISSWIERGDRPQKCAQIKGLMEREFRSATTDPATYAKKIEMFENTTSQEHFSGIWSAGLPRT